MYNIDYFIEKFEQIPKEHWTKGSFQKGVRYCVYGHCGMTDAVVRTEESDALDAICDKYNISLVSVNDNDNPNFKQRSIKERVLAALRFMKELENESK